MHKISSHNGFQYIDTSVRVCVPVSFCSSAPEPFSLLLVQPFGLTSSISSIISDPEKSEGERIT